MSQSLLRKLKNQVLISVVGMLPFLGGCVATFNDVKEPVVAATLSTPPLPAKRQTPKTASASAQISPETDLYALKVQPIQPTIQWVQIGRYRVISALPSKEQRDLLQVIIDMTLPEEVQTVHTAIRYLLAKSGYHFHAMGLSPEVRQLLQKPLPAVHRHLGPMTLQAALTILAGAPYQLTVDPVHRRVSYTVLLHYTTNHPIQP